MAAQNDRVLKFCGGPVGATGAYLLGYQGIPVTVLEKEAGDVVDYRASIIHPPKHDLLEGCGATAAMQEMELVCPVWQFRYRQEGSIAQFALSVPAGEPRHPCRLQCAQLAGRMALPTVG